MLVGGCGRQDKPEVLMRSSQTWSYSNLWGLSPDQIMSYRSYLTAITEHCHGIVFASREQSSQRFQSYLEPHSRTEASQRAGAALH